jgi:CBS domain containing-hemolysin-like protein
MNGPELFFANGLLVLVFVVCLALSCFLSGMEAGVFALSRLRIRHWMRAGRPRAALLYRYLEDPENFLWTILVGNTLANLGIVSIGVHWLYRGLAGRPWLLLPTLAVGVFVFYAACELLPKMVFRLYPNRLCMTFAVPFRLVHLALRPFVAAVTLFSEWLLHWAGGIPFTGHLFANRDELRLVMQESSQSLTSDERAMINRVLDLQNLTLRQIAIPLNQAVTVTANAPVEEILNLARTHGFSRVPVWSSAEERRRIIGFVSVRSLLFEEKLDPAKTAGDYLKPALYLEEETRLEVALRQMQRTAQRLAIVIGRDQRELGIASLQDILKVIFGEVRL